jgi:hypothetical protein
MKAFIALCAVIALIAVGAFVAFDGDAQAKINPIQEAVGNVLDIQVFKYTDGEATCYVARHYQGAQHAGIAIDCVK